MKYILTALFISLAFAMVMMQYSIIWGQQKDSGVLRLEVGSKKYQILDQPVGNGQRMWTGNPTGSFAIGSKLVHVYDISAIPYGSSIHTMQAKCDEKVVDNARIVRMGDVVLVYSVNC